jgi:hypothetical protein
VDSERQNQLEKRLEMSCKKKLRESAVFSSRKVTPRWDREWPSNAQNAVTRTD